VTILQLYKNAYSGLAPNNWYLSIVMFINRSGTMVVPYMTLYCINQLHFSVAQAGYVLAFFGVGAILGSYIGGWLTDRIGFYDMQAVTLLSGGAMFIVLGYQHTFFSMCLGAFILSFFNEAFRPANSAAIAYYSAPQNKTRSYSLHRLATNLGWAFGAAIGGFIASVNYHLLFWVDGSTNILAALMLMKLIPRSTYIKPVKNVLKSITAISAYRDKPYLVFIVLVTLFNICFYQFFIMEPVFLKVQWQFSLRFIGFLLALNGIVIALVELIMINYLEGRKPALVYIIYGVLITGGGFVLLNVLPPGPAAGILIVLFITFGEMMSMPFMNSFWTTRAGAHNAGQYAGLYAMSWSAAQVIAPALSGEVISVGGFSLLWYGLFALCLVVATGLWLMHTKLADKHIVAQNQILP
jgi:predicted MFS family arabinose efflux permease